MLATCTSSFFWRIQNGTPYEPTAVSLISWGAADSQPRAYTSGREGAQVFFKWTPPNFCANQRGGSKGIFMRLIRLRAPGGLENLNLVEEEHPKPRPGELLVRIRPCSLNFRDDFVVQGKTPCADGRVPLSDGAGEVIAVGDATLTCTGVTAWRGLVVCGQVKPGDTVLILGTGSGCCRIFLFLTC